MTLFKLQNKTSGMISESTLRISGCNVCWRVNIVHIDHNLSCRLNGLQDCAMIENLRIKMIRKARETERSAHFNWFLQEQAVLHVMTSNEKSQA